MASQKPAKQSQSEQRKRPAPTILELRLRDLSRLRAGRYGETMPDTPDTRRLISIIAQHLAAMPGAKALQTIPSWLSLYAPWCTPPQAAILIADVLNAPKFWKAHDLAWALKLTAADRKALRITTIGACDMSPAQRAKQRKLMKRLEREEKRRAKGAIPREQYLAKSLMKLKPWQQQGISRAHWYRLQKAK